MESAGNDGEGGPDFIYSRVRLFPFTLSELKICWIFKFSRLDLEKKIGGGRGIMQGFD